MPVLPSILVHILWIKYNGHSRQEIKKIISILCYKGKLSHDGKRRSSRVLTNLNRKNKPKFSGNEVSKTVPMPSGKVWDSSPRSKVEVQMVDELVCAIEPYRSILVYKLRMKLEWTFKIKNQQNILAKTPQLQFFE